MGTLNKDKLSNICSNINRHLIMGKLSRYGTCRCSNICITVYLYVDISLDI